MIADDSGIEVKALNGLPGVHSARFAGINATSEENNKKLFFELRDYVNSEDRKAKLMCVLCLKIEAGIYIFTEGELEGEIVQEDGIGKVGWGYEPIFYLRDKGVTLGEAKFLNLGHLKTLETHRNKAIIKLLNYLNS